ncbi:MAG: ATP synthase F1 subunit gamma [Saprospiraceae bacterium]|nr:ATP synthase F1 subunit gamma [Saprospiraceae bacterium]
MSGQLKEVRERIKSVINTQQITKAMKMVSAAKLRKAQMAIQQARPYANKLTSMLRNVMMYTDDSNGLVFNRATEKKRPVVIVVTSNRGLCGAYNSNIVKEAMHHIKENYQQAIHDRSLRIIPIGKKALDVLKRQFDSSLLIRDFLDLGEKIEVERVYEFADFLMEQFRVGNFDVVDVSYGRFRNAAMQFPETVQYLPVAPLPKAAEEKHKIIPNYTFEPDEASLLQELVPAILKVQIHRFLLDNAASEHGARMTAMDKASENADELLRELRINYNKARQAAITTELSEIVAGAAALGG